MCTIAKSGSSLLILTFRIMLNRVNAYHDIGEQHVFFPIDPLRYQEMEKQIEENQDVMRCHRLVNSTAFFPLDLWLFLSFLNPLSFCHPFTRNTLLTQKSCYRFHSIASFWRQEQRSWRTGAPNKNYKALKKHFAASNKHDVFDLRTLSTKAERNNLM